MTLHPKKGSTDMAPTETTEGAVKLPSIALDFKVPLTYLLAAATFIGTGLVGMYYQLSNLTEKVTTLQIDVKAANASTIQFAQEQALIKFRVEKLETEKGVK